jgi:hypothetical protein
MKKCWLFSVSYGITWFKPLITTLVHYLRFQLTKRILMPRLIHATKHPRDIQQQILLQILRRNSRTEFGQQHHFLSITDINNYCHQVPIQTFDTLQQAIEKQMQGQSALLAATPSLYVCSSGTTGAVKYLPVSQQAIRAYRRTQAIAAFAQQRDIPHMFSGKILAIVSPAIEGYIPTSGAHAAHIPYGSMSGVVYATMPSVVRDKYVLPPSIFDIKDYETKYLLISALAMMEPNITVLASANPSTFIRIQEIINTHTERLLRFIHDGDIRSLEITGGAPNIAVQWRANPSRASALRSHWQHHGTLSLRYLWPQLKTVVTWTHGSCAMRLPKLRSLLPTHTVVVEMGYLASEFRGSVTIDCIHNQELPTIQDNFFEFVPVDAWERGDQRTHLIDDLILGKHYYIIATTQSGLYRYFINDIVEVTGFYNKTPTLAFIQKGKGVTNIVGEKLYESQAIQATEESCRKLDLENIFFLLIADPTECHYTLYLEAHRSFDATQFAQMYSETLAQANLEFREKMASSRLQPPRVKPLKPGTAHAYKAHNLAAGQRETQYKILHLQYREHLTFPIEHYTLHEN